MTENPKPTLVIGDTHGHLDRLEGLLLQEGVLERDGDELVRNDEVEVVHLGDLGDFRMATLDQDRQSFTKALVEGWVDYLLWGNHERAVVDRSLAFGGYYPPLSETQKLITEAMDHGTLRLAHVAHDFLLVHAGLPKSFRSLCPKLIDQTNPAEVARYLNDTDERAFPGDPAPQVERRELDNFLRLRDSIGPHRGGMQPNGGLLWRDAREKLYTGLRQVFGHSSGDKVRKYQTPLGYSYCVDMSKHGHVGAIWLPEERPVTY